MSTRLVLRFLVAFGGFLVGIAIAGLNSNHSVPAAGSYLIVGLAGFIALLGGTLLIVYGPPDP